MKLVPSEEPLVGIVDLPISKSIANRYLILASLASSEATGYPFQNLALNELSKNGHQPESLPDDVNVLFEALTSSSTEINVGMAGTAMRFLTAFYAIQDGRSIILTGNARMKKRPISELVTALKSLGAEIKYLEEEEFPPVKVNGKRLTGGQVSISGSVSSQYISALMMIGPTLENGLKIILSGQVLSMPYIELTAKVMTTFGVGVVIEKGIISIPNGNYSIPKKEVETDWSAASYFYSLACLRPNSKLLLKGLRLDSDQGDAVLSKLFKPLGVSSEQKEAGVEITSSGINNFPNSMDFKDNPDLAQTFAFLTAALGQSMELTGLDNLRIKETNRVAALETELEKIGITVVVEGDRMTVAGSISVEEADISTYNDHRMAMSASVLASQIPLTIENPEVVAKSFPEFWSQLQSVGVYCKG